MDDVMRSYVPQRQADLDRVMRGWVARTCIGIRVEAKRRCPKGASAMLRDSIRELIYYPDVSFVIVGMSYARYVEGYPVVTRRHFTPYRGNYMFRRWAKQRGKIKSVSDETGGLLTWGYRNPFFSTAVEVMQSKATAEARRLRLT